MTADTTFTLETFKARYPEAGDELLHQTDDGKRLIAAERLLLSAVQGTERFKHVSFDERKAFIDALLRTTTPSAALKHMPVLKPLRDAETMLLSKIPSLVGGSSQGCPAAAVTEVSVEISTPVPPSIFCLLSSVCSLPVKCRLQGGRLVTAEAPYGRFLFRDAGGRYHYRLTYALQEIELNGEGTADGAIPKGLPLYLEEARSSLMHAADIVGLRPRETADEVESLCRDALAALDGAVMYLKLMQGDVPEIREAEAAKRASEQI